MTSQNPTSWIQHLNWVEYATGLSPFQCVYVYLPPVFPDLMGEVAAPSAQALVQRCQLTWRRGRAVLLRMSDRYKRAADKHRTPVPRYRVEQRVFVRPFVWSIASWRPGSSARSPSQSNLPRGGPVRTPKDHAGPPSFPCLL